MSQYHLNIVRSMLTYLSQDTSVKSPHFLTSPETFFFFFFWLEHATENILWWAFALVHSTQHCWFGTLGTFGTWDLRSAELSEDNLLGNGGGIGKWKEFIEMSPMGDLDKATQACGVSMFKLGNLPQDSCSCCSLGGANDRGNFRKANSSHMLSCCR